MLLAAMPVGAEEAALAATPQPAAVPAPPVPVSQAVPTAVPAAPVSASESAKKIVTKNEIRDLLLMGNVHGAETAYLAWASCWQEEDPAMLAEIERGVLMKQYKAGDIYALDAMLRVNDPGAMVVLRSKGLLTNPDLTPDQRAALITLVGRYGDASAYRTLREALHADDNQVVNAAIVALGSLGDRRAAPILLKMFDEADLNRSLLLAQSLTQMGAGRQVAVLFAPQLKSTEPQVAERAALMLGMTGNSEGWVIIRHLVASKVTPFYPDALRVLAKLPLEESRDYVTQALESGGEVERLAALQSIAILPPATMNAELRHLLRVKDCPPAVREKVIQLIAKTSEMERATPDIRAMALANGGEAAMVKDAAMLSLPVDTLESLEDRDQLRQMVYSNDPQIASAARATLLGYAISQTDLSKKLRKSITPPGQ